MAIVTANEGQNLEVRTVVLMEIRKYDLDVT
jgi:hypothetical protein